MRRIISPLSGFRRPLSRPADKFAVYAVLGKQPGLVLDFVGDIYVVSE